MADFHVFPENVDYRTYRTVKYDAPDSRKTSEGRLRQSYVCANNANGSRRSSRGGNGREKAEKRNTERTIIKERRFVADFRRANLRFPTSTYYPD